VFVKDVDLEVMPTSIFLNDDDQLSLKALQAVKQNITQFKKKLFLPSMTPSQETTQLHSC